MTFPESVARSLEVNQQIKHSSKWAMPKKIDSVWCVVVVCTLHLVNQYQDGKAC